MSLEKGGHVFVVLDHDKLTNTVECISSSNIRLRLTIDVSRYEGVSQLYLGKTGL